MAVAAIRGTDLLFRVDTAKPKQNSPIIFLYPAFQISTAQGHLGLNHRPSDSDNLLYLPSHSCLNKTLRSVFFASLLQTLDYDHLAKSGTFSSQFSQINKAKQSYSPILISIYYILNYLITGLTHAAGFWYESEAEGFHTVAATLRGKGEPSPS